MSRVGGMTLMLWLIAFAYWLQKSSSLVIFRKYIKVTSLFLCLTLHRVEHVLSLSRNTALDCMLSMDNLQDAQRKLAEETQILNDRCYLGAAYLQAIVRFHAIGPNLLERRINDISLLSAMIRAQGVRTAVLDAWKNPNKAKSTIYTHAACEPTTGKCDAILFTPANATGTQLTPELSDYFEKFRLLRSREVLPYIDDYPFFSMTEAEQKKLDMLMRTDENDTKNAKRILAATKNPSENAIDYSRALFSVQPPTDQSQSDASITPDAHALPHDKPVIMLPGLIFEYKKRCDEKTKALHQERSYLVSATTMLASLGIMNFPVFGVVTSGGVGGLVMAWYSDERKVLLFQITVPHTLTMSTR